MQGGNPGASVGLISEVGCEVRLATAMIDQGSWDTYLVTGTTVPLLFLLPEDLAIDQGCLHPERLTDLDHGEGKKNENVFQAWF